MPKTLKHGKTGNPVVQIWQPCMSYTILNASIQFLKLKNMGLARKIMFLSLLEPNICRKHLKYGKTGNPAVKIWQSCRLYNILSASIRFLSHRNMSLARKNKVSKSIRIHYMPKTLNYGKTGNPVVQI